MTPEKSITHQLESDSPYRACEALLQGCTNRKNSALPRQGINLTIKHRLHKWNSQASLFDQGGNIECIKQCKHGWQIARETA